MKQVAFIRDYGYVLFHSATKDKGLKISILYLHQKGIFEVWLSRVKEKYPDLIILLFANKILI